MRTSAASGLAIALAHCTVLTSLDGLTGGAGDGGNPTDASMDALADAPVEGGEAAAMDETGVGDASKDGAFTTTFLDDFNRPGDAGIGNQWTQKTPNSFLLLGNAVERQASAPGLEYWDFICYRPASEDVLDVEVSIEFKNAHVTPRSPQIWLRTQSNSVAAVGSLDGYVLYVDADPTSAIIGRQGGGSFATTLVTLTISPPLNTIDTYRLRLSATGVATVALQAYVERLNSSTWDVIGQAGYSDTSPARILTAGTVGFGGGSSETTGEFTYDNFVRVAR